MFSERPGSRQGLVTLVPDADDYVKFSVTGEGSVIGDQSIFANPRQAQAGIAAALILASLKAGTITVTAEARGLKPAGKSTCRLDRISPSPWTHLRSGYS
jgi:Glycoside hydrolase family 2 C-terminal domain 5